MGRNPKLQTPFHSIRVGGRLGGSITSALSFAAGLCGHGVRGQLIDQLAYLCYAICLLCAVAQARQGPGMIDD